jgi:hypothetical protein
MVSLYTKPCRHVNRKSYPKPGVSLYTVLSVGVMYAIQQGPSVGIPHVLVPCGIWLTCLREGTINVGNKEVKGSKGGNGGVTVAWTNNNHNTGQMKFQFNMYFSCFLFLYFLVLGG